VRPCAAACAPDPAYGPALSLTTKVHSFIAITRDRWVKLWVGWQKPPVAAALTAPAQEPVALACRSGGGGMRELQ